MSELHVALKLKEHDLERLWATLTRASSLAARKGEAEILDAAVDLIEEIRRSPAPSYIVERAQQLDLLVGMLRDVGWPMPEDERQRALTAIAYFADPHDLIPDHIPVLGFLDDAVMIELAIRELQHEIAGYEEFCRYRHQQWEVPWHKQSAGSRDRRIEKRRQQLRARIQSRASR